MHLESPIYYTPDPMSQEPRQARSEPPGVLDLDKLDLAAIEIQIDQIYESIDHRRDPHVVCTGMQVIDQMMFIPPRASRRHLSG